MKKAYRYKMRPTEEQTVFLAQSCGSSRFVYNNALGRIKVEYEKNRKFPSYNQLSAELTQLKHDGEHEWLNDVYSVCLVQSLRNLDNAMKRFHKKQGRFPRFKSKHGGKDTCKFLQCIYIDFDEKQWKLKLPKVGWIGICKNRAFDTQACDIRSVTVSRDRCGDFWCSVLVETNEPCKPKTKACKRSAVGIDLGIKNHATLSNGEIVMNPRLRKRFSKRLKTLQRHFSKAVKESRRRERLRWKIARLHCHIANCRQDHIHKFTTDIVRRFDTICVEDLNVSGMLKNHKLAGEIQDVSFCEIRQQLEYKCEWYGKNLLVCDRFDATSKTCSVCGHKLDELSLSTREWTCPACGARHDRDVNAAQNILEFAFRERVNNDPQARGTETGGEGNAVGHPVKRQDKEADTSV